MENDPRKQANDELWAKVQKLITDEINPALASHGGSVKLLRVDDFKLYVRLGGGCQGCAGAKATMKNGIEKAIRSQIPEVKEVIDMTDHDSGGDPSGG
ncbi:MAG: NifU family protein [Elusimicrobiota bacterium]